MTVTKFLGRIPDLPNQRTQRHCMSDEPASQVYAPRYHPTIQSIEIWWSLFVRPQRPDVAGAVRVDVD